MNQAQQIEHYIREAGLTPGSVHSAWLDHTDMYFARDEAESTLYALYGLRCVYVRPVRRQASKFIGALLVIIAWLGVGIVLGWKVMR